MTYVVTDACIRCKYMDCVEVCPVDCFYEGENMLVINPNECINCLHCQVLYQSESVCPVVIKKMKSRAKLAASPGGAPIHHQPTAKV